MKLRNLQIQRRLQLNLAILFVSFTVLVVFTLNTTKSSLIEQKYEKTQSIVEVAYNVIEYNYSRMASEEISLEQAQKDAMSIIAALRYDDNNYYWINDYSAMMLMHPIQPALNGNDLTNFKDPKGNLLFQEMTDIVKQHSQGFVPYYLEVSGKDAPVAKIGYVKGFKEWQWIVGSAIYLDDVEKEFFSMAKVSISIVTISFFVITFLTVFIQRSILRPLNKTVDVITNISEGEGDLTQRLQVHGKDELTQLTHGFNKFSDKIKKLIDNVQQSANIVKDNAKSLDNLNQQAKSLAEQQNKKTGQLELSMTEMHSTINDIANNADNAANETDEGRKLINKGKHIVLETVAEINTLSNNVKDAAAVIKLLAQESESIGSVLEVIRSIADQTNLLALNAAIEAARAGEQGRGFAVVADEVRSLASRTGKATEEIQNMIHKLQQGSQSAVTVIEQSVDKAITATKYVNQANDSLHDISEVIKR
mgnify:CR=1 FL=1